MSLEAKAIFVTASEICIMFTLTGLVGGMAQPPSDIILSQIPRSYAAGFVFSGFDPLSQDFQLAKVTSPIAVPSIPYTLNAMIGGCFVRANAYYLPANAPLPDYPEPGNGRYEGATSTPTPGQFDGGGGQSGGGGASGDWGVKPEPTGGAWYLPKNLLQGSVTAAGTYFDNNSFLSSNGGLSSFFWVFSGDEPAEHPQHILNAPFHADTYYGVAVQYPGDSGANTYSSIVDAPGYNGLLSGFGVGRFSLISGGVSVNEINVSVWGNSDFPGMYFPDRPGTIPVTPGFLVPKARASNVPALVALMGLRLWGRKRV